MNSNISSFPECTDEEKKYKVENNFSKIFVVLIEHGFIKTRFRDSRFQKDPSQIIWIKGIDQYLIEEHTPGTLQSSVVNRCTGVADAMINLYNAIQTKQSQKKIDEMHLAFVNAEINRLALLVSLITWIYFFIINHMFLY